MSSDRTDQHLYKVMQSGDSEAFNVLFKRYYPMLCAYGRQFVDLSDAEEIVQDILMWLWENRNKERIEVSLRQYLFRSVKNRSLTLIQRNSVKQRVATQLHAKLQEKFDDPDFYIVEELSAKIDHALKALPESYRVAFEMNRFQHKSYHEIAEELGVSVKTIDYRIQQSLKLLRVSLKDYLPMLMLLYHTTIK